MARRQPQRHDHDLIPLFDSPEDDLPGVGPSPGMTTHTQHQEICIMFEPHTMEWGPAHHRPDDSDESDGAVRPDDN